MNFIIIVLLLLAAALVFLFLKFKETRHKLTFVIAGLLLFFLIVSVWQLYTSNSLDFTSYDGVIDAGRVYFSWLGGVFDNMVKIAGYAVDLNWGIDSVGT